VGKSEYFHFPDISHNRGMEEKTLYTDSLGQAQNHIPNHDILSRREKEILLGLAVGKTVTEIARGASLSVKTVSTYRTRMLRKMGFQNNQEIMQYASKSKLIP